MWATPVVNGNGIPPAATNGGGMTQDLIGSSSECAASPPSSDSAIHSESQGGGILIDLDNATQPSITPQSPPSFDPLGDLQQFNSAATPKDPVPASTNPFADPISDPFSVQPAANPPQSNQALQILPSVGRGLKTAMNLEASLSILNNLEATSKTSCKCTRCTSP